MGRKCTELLLFLITICSFSLFAQDNTNNKMQDKSNSSDDKYERMINKNANYYSNDLSAKLNLTKSQVKYVHTILYTYYSNEAAGETTQMAALREKQESLNLEQDPLMKDGRNIRVSDYDDKDLVDEKDYPLSKIETVLDHEQMNKWLMIKDAWMLNVKSVISNSGGGLEENEINKEKREYEDSRDYEDYDVYSPGYDVK